MSHLEPRQYRTIFRISFLSIGSSIYAIYHRHYTLALCPAGVLFTSINYWRKPEPWARTLDMTYVLFALTYQLYKAYAAQYRIYYYSITLLAGSMYPLALYYSSQKQYWHSTYAHCGIHVLANVANLVLYSGNIR
jgi:hypothetical protein